MEAVSSPQVKWGWGGGQGLVMIIWLLSLWYVCGEGGGLRFGKTSQPTNRPCKQRVVGWGGMGNGKRTKHASLELYLYNVGGQGLQVYPPNHGQNA